MTADEALNHPFITSLQLDDENDLMDHIVELPLDDNKRYTIE